jgi:hypothetical protein
MVALWVSGFVVVLLVSLTIGQFCRLSNKLNREQ